MYLLALLLIVSQALNPGMPPLAILVRRSPHSLRPTLILVRLYREVLISLQTAALAALCLFAGSGGAFPGAAAAQGPAAVQEPAAARRPSPAEESPPAEEQAAAPPVSLDRIRDGVVRTPALRLDQKPPTPTFRTTTEGRVLMLPFQQYLRQQLELTPLQRQSADWASRCCGMDLGQLFKGLEQALDRRRTRKIRERISQELADLEASRAARGEPVKCMR